jgi:hypothetical protein
MASSGIREEVRNRLKSLRSGESESDVVSLVDILAQARAQAASRPMSSADEEYSAKILCIVFDPVKTNLHRDFVQQLRLSFRGVADSEALQNAFKESLTKEILTDVKLETAMDRGPEALFNVSNVLRGA